VRYYIEELFITISEHMSISEQTSHMTGRRRSPNRKLRAWRPLVSVITTLHYVAKLIFHRRVWYRALSLRYACIRSSGIILIPQSTFVPNFVSFATSIVELAHGEKSRTQSLTQSLTQLI